MSLQLVANAKYLAGLSMALTATNSTPEADVFVSYEFKQDGVVKHTDTKAAYTKAKAELSDAGSWTITGIKEDDTQIESTPKVIAVENQTMTLGVTVAPTTKTVTIGDTVAFKATVTGAPSAATFTYEWTVDGVAATGAKALDFSHTFTKSGSSKVACKVSAKATDFNDASKTSADSTITVNLKQMIIDVSILPATQTVEVGEEYTVEIDIAHEPEGSTVTYLWDTGETTKSITKTADVEGNVKPTGTVKVTATDYTPFEFTGSADVIVEAATPEVEGCIRYIHPLDHRESAYIWAGWWVVNEIQVAKELGLDWKKPEGTSLKYQCDLKTLAKMIKDYPNIEVQESRNGYIFNEAELERGYIY